METRFWGTPKSLLLRFVSLPMRDGNPAAAGSFSHLQWFVSLPMRDGNNSLRWNNDRSKAFVSLPLRDGNGAPYSLPLYPVRVC